MQNNKRDGNLMAQNVDWKNANERAIEQKGAQIVTIDLDGKDRKYQNLQSSVFGGGYVEQAPINYDRDEKRYAFTSTADWKDEVTKAKPNNGAANKDPYKCKQRELGSCVLEQTDYQ